LDQQSQIGISDNCDILGDFCIVSTLSKCVLLT